VKAHQRKSMLAMAAGMLVALPFFVVGLALHYAIMLPGFLLGALVWKKLRPANANPLADI
jgi:Na+/citrate or Na+/malate symporter